ncbi:matrin 3-like 1.1 [Conger conger]|uniref:matrin 3-like 1.1 n=1 Tax=Conger conger TaxID=82655 RepID=UPI002A5A1C13|nr:matrin 3-like 1.1 [Conger conger]
MSHNNPYSRSTTDLSSHQGAFYTSGHLHHEEHDIYRTSLQPSPQSTSVFTTPKSALESYSSQSTTTSESALSLLSSCGLEPADLSILAGMPENMITEETLPRLLMEIRQKKALRDHSHSSSPHRSTCHQPLQPSSDKWENSVRAFLAEYPANPPQRPSYPSLPTPHTSYPLPREETDSWKDRWGNPRQTGAVRQEKPSSTYVVDYNYGRLQEGDSRRLERPAYSARAVGIGERPHLQSSSDYRQLNPGKAPAATYQKKQILPLATAVHSTPTAREADDFHGAAPQTFPYACILCDIAVLSEKDWTLHINGAQHADSQLAMLQMYPDWDCRTRSARQSDSSSEKGRKEKNTGGSRHGATQHYGVTPSCEGKSSPAGEKAAGRVVCAKYAANSMNERSLRRLVNQVGTAVNVMMFPVQGFIEMSTPDEADAVIKYFNRNPVVVEGSHVQFSMSATYNFLQNSPVVIFSLLPPGNAVYAEMMGIAKLFGPVKHSLFFPNQVLVEMGSREDAGKLVQYYTSHPLKMSGKIIQVSHSTEYSTLKFAVSDKHAEDGEASRHSGQLYRSQTRSSPSPRRRSPIPRRSPNMRKRYPSPRSRSPSQKRRSPSPRRRSYSPRRTSPNTRKRSYSPRGTSPNTRRRSPIQMKRSLGNRRRSRSPRRKSREKCDVAPKVEDKASVEETRSSSRHRNQSSRRSTSHTREDKSNSIRHSVEKTVNTEKAVVKGVLTETPDLGSSQEPSCINPQESVPSPKEHPKDHGTAQKMQDQTEDCEGGNYSDMDSDIEGMAVIGEDEEMRSEAGSMESLEEMEEHVSDEAGKERTLADDLSICPSEAAEASEKEKQVETVKAVQVEKQEEGQHELGEPNEAYEEDEPDFPESLENCITLDELEDDDNEGQTLSSRGNFDQRSMEEEQEHGRVIYIQNLPFSYYTDKEFVELGKKYGKVNRYFLIRRRQEGFIEMERSADALRAVRELSRKCVAMDRNILVIHLSRKYKRLTCGWKPESDSEDDSEQRKCRRERRRRERERTKSSKEEEPPAKICIREEKTAQAEANSSTKEEEKAATEEPSSNGGQQQEEEEKGASETPCKQEELAGKKENEDVNISLPSNSVNTQEKADTEEPSSNGEPQQEEEEMGASETPCEQEELAGKTENEDVNISLPSNSVDTQEKAGTEDPSSNEKQHQEEEMGASETSCEQEKLAVKTENEDVQLSQPSDSMDTQKTDTEGETSDENSDGIKQVCVQEGKVEMITEPTHVPVGPYLPNNPMGREFVSQKIGYFCRLCNAIYVTEDEARNEHCSSLSHYEKLKAYLEQNGNPN